MLSCRTSQFRRRSTSEQWPIRPGRYGCQNIIRDLALLFGDLLALLADLLFLSATPDAGFIPSCQLVRLPVGGACAHPPYRSRLASICPAPWTVTNDLTVGRPRTRLKQAEGFGGDLVRWPANPPRNAILPRTLPKRLRPSRLGCLESPSRRQNNSPQ